MKISVENYGPIAEAKDIELRPLTVFVGPSNTGKSYLAILIYSLLKSLERIGLWGRFYIGSQLWRPISNVELSKISNWIGDYFNETYTGLSDWPEEFRKWTGKKIAKAINLEFHKDISQCLGISQGRQQVIGKKFNLHFEDSPKGLIFELTNKTAIMELRKLNVKHLGASFPKNATQKTKAEIFLSRISADLFRSHLSLCFYLPAARTGIMQSYRAIAGSLIQQATYTSFELIPTLSGIVSDFLRGFISLDTDSISNSDVNKVAGKMESEILSGVIKAESPGANPPLQILYRQNDLEIPLLSSSAMVSELAPVILFLKHKVTKGDLLIIEEPEAHLHPEAQRKVATAIVRLIRAGVRVMVTTHSSYVLEQLANHVRLSKLNEEQRSKLTEGDTPLLKETEIAAYSFQRRKTGTIVKNLPFDEDGELSPEDHDQESLDIYNQSAKLQDAVEGN